MEPRGDSQSLFLLYLISKAKQVLKKTNEKEGKKQVMKAKCTKCGARYYGWALENLIRRNVENVAAHWNIIDNDLPYIRSARSKTR